MCCIKCDEKIDDAKYCPYCGEGSHFIIKIFVKEIKCG